MKCTDNSYIIRQILYLHMHRAGLSMSGSLGKGHLGAPLHFINLLIHIFLLKRNFFYLGKISDAFPWEFTTSKGLLS